MILIGLSIVAFIYIVACLALRHAPFPESHVLGCRTDSVRAGKLPAGAVSTSSEPATNLAEYKNLERLMREYVAATECQCIPGSYGFECWHCVFEYNLRRV